jgi:CTP:molybdopterin cytidylyltransferase MocA
MRAALIVILIMTSIAFRSEAAQSTVVVHHYDDWRVPLSSGMTAAVRRRAQRLEKDVKSVDRNIKVIIPEFLQTITLE